jgi:hypothetical protein
MRLLCLGCGEEANGDHLSGTLSGAVIPVVSSR